MSLAVCRDSHGHPLDFCRLHGSADIHADSLEDAYRIMDSSRNSGGDGLSSEHGAREAGPASRVASLLPPSDPIPRLRGSGSMVAHLLAD